jgi:surface antigen
MQRGLVLAGLSVVLAACTTGSGVPRSGIAGANPVAVVGSPVGSGEGEPMLGMAEAAVTGADVGRSLTAEDRRLALQAEYEALEYGRGGQATEWRNRVSGNYGRIVVAAVYEVNNLDCREYTHTVYVGGRARVVRGTACREPGAVWRVVG